MNTIARPTAIIEVHKTHGGKPDTYTAPVFPGPMRGWAIDQWGTLRIDTADGRVVIVAHAWRHATIVTDDGAITVTPADTSPEHLP